MNEALIHNFNGVVGKTDITIHCGDFCWEKKEADAMKIVRRLNGNHVFLRGSHDRWLPKSAKFMWREHIEKQFIVACHYAMRTWERAHYGAWQVYGHSHGTLQPIGKQWDVGVDNNNFYPVSFGKLSLIMDSLPMVHSPEHDKPKV